MTLQSGVSGGAGISRTLFYRWQRRSSRYGVDGLHPRRLKARPGPAPQLPPVVERRLPAVAIAEAKWGAGWVAAYAQRLWRLRVAPNTVQRLLRCTVWLRSGSACSSSSTAAPRRRGC